MTEETDEVVHPSNPATALYRIAKTVYLKNNGASFYASMVSAFGDVPFGSTEFLRCHAQTLNLLDHVRLIVQSDPNLSEHFDVYLPSWHGAFAPSQDWSCAGKEIAGPNEIRPLGHLGTTLEAMRVGGGRWDATTQRGFAGILEHWNAVLTDAGLPEPVVRDLRRKIEELQWLMESVGLFGVAPVKDAAGKLVTAGSTEAMKPTTGPSAKAKLVYAVGITLTCLATADDVVSGFAGVLDSANTVVTEVRELGANLSKFSLPPVAEDVAPEQLPSDDVIDGVIVDEEPDEAASW
ncbi:MULTISPECIES: hypothetical protein [unclassified Gordonia (in: high G+C Gram-positive bacteria)]|uniref:hypothetical protein n=1 Tax=unclassified Gordonia (in: high G+C Gram-positive bacteria) TaxID=2657482 RepID=UPI00083B5F6B|nr:MULTISPECIES: hypothetical protein [unclassified Gordonia (in: high G+C Gram-positive bacteria)]MBN0975502.1 hypothetical protein [Gordonia sp. BP-119]MBN0984027.1 hypothetical protein [Gordonia sp. BP-94]OCW85626.1 hypothetical protein A8M60_04815 [Nocardia farcinica]WGJ84200.1 hypothetical protein QAD21_15545 [Gordonia sp. SMJS1]